MRHHEVEPDHLHVDFAIECLERLDTVEGERHPERSLLELHLDDAADMWLVVDDQDVSPFRRRILYARCESVHTREAMLAR